MAGRTIVCGHRPAYMGYYFDPTRANDCNEIFYGQGMIALDAHTVRSGRVNVLVKITRESLAWLEANGYEPEIRGLCWMQGEADACDATTNALYGGRYDALVRDFKAAFPTYTQSCVFADAGVSTTWPFYREMNAFKAEYAATHENCVYVDTIGNGLTTAHEPEPQNDPSHYDVNSTIDLGHLFIRAVMEGKA